MAKLKWTFKRVDRSFSGMNDAYFYKNNDIFNPYIIRMQIICPDLKTTNVVYHIYDTRHYSNMATIDFNFFGYSRMSGELKILSYAKKRVKQLYKQEQIKND